MAVFTESSMATLSEQSVAFVSEVCVEVVAVVVTLVCVSVIRLFRHTATKTSCKKVVEDVETETEAETTTDVSNSTVVESVDDEVICADVETETTEFMQVAQRMAALLERNVDVELDDFSKMLSCENVEEKVNCEDKETDVTEFMQVAQRMSLLFEDHVVVELDDFSKKLLGEGTEDDVDCVDKETERLELAQVAERMAALFERIADVEADDFAKKLSEECSDASTAYGDEVLSSSDEFVCDEQMNMADWDDVSCRMGNLLKGLVEREYDSAQDQLLDDDSPDVVVIAGARCSAPPKRSNISAASILESYGVLGAASGTWTSTNWR